MYVSVGVCEFEPSLQRYADFTRVLPFFASKASQLEHWVVGTVNDKATARFPKHAYHDASFTYGDKSTTPS